MQHYKSNLICRNNHFSILTGWGDGNSPLKKVILEVFPQSECNRKYTVSEFDDFKPRIDQNLPQLFQDTLLCAAVCTIKIKSLITYLWFRYKMFTIYTTPIIYCDKYYLLILQNAEKGSCHGDSGGPLIIENKETHPSRHIQIGIVTGAAICGSERFPSVYARIDNPDIWNFIYDTIF